MILFFLSNYKHISESSYLKSIIWLMEKLQMKKEVFVFIVIVVGMLIACCFLPFIKYM